MYQHRVETKHQYDRTGAERGHGISEWHRHCSHTWWTRSYWYSLVRKVYICVETMWWYRINLRASMINQKRTYSHHCPSLYKTTVISLTCHSLIFVLDNWKAAPYQDCCNPEKYTNTPFIWRYNIRMSKKVWRRSLLPGCRCGLCRCPKTDREDCESV